MNIWLDDVRPAPNGDVWYRDAESLIQALQSVDYWNTIDLMSLDHDLGDGRKTGYDVAQEIERLVIQEGRSIVHILDITVHSQNPIGRRNMQAAIRNAYQVSFRRFAENAS